MEIILTNLGVEKKEKINLNQVRNLQKIMAKSISNGDGIITSDATEDEEIATFIKLIIEKFDSKMDASGAPGIDKEIVNNFFHQCQEFLEWKEKGKISEGKEKTEIMVFGQQTPTLYEIYKQVEGKIDQYFLLSSLSHFDEKTKNLINLSEEEVKNFNVEDRNEIIKKLEKLPIAPLNKELVLDFENITNILYKQKLEKFKKNILNRVFPEFDKLTLQQWEEIKNCENPL